ncbi:Uridine kinase [Seminavis robusta]|uniref:uridine/cytidine kinase n=1 Tax=Seminavis robusta TaxID=568900 RepID=A0A9N8E5G0_9STRA|nr:Uridine kinase [Seminavis robusta]|eukprot:Sro692_g188060.1 Uridine kinase (185) ;mRNA; f:24482-25036
MLSYDSYYRDQSDKPVEERAKTNFDHPDSLETELLIQHLQDLKEGKSVDIPHYDFATHARIPDKVDRVEQSAGDSQKRIKVIILEGILVLTNRQLMDQMDIKVFVDVDADIRFIRRLNRDTTERGRSMESVMEQYQQTVRPMHEQWVEPSKHHADIIVFSTTQSLDVAIDMLANHLSAKAAKME